MFMCSAFDLTHVIEELEMHLLLIYYYSSDQSRFVAALVVLVRTILLVHW